MFMACLEDETVWRPVAGHPVIIQSLEWLTQNAASSECGIYPIGEPSWYANVHEYQTRPVDSCTWENHPGTIDIQYVISGYEGILWASAGRLGKPARYLAEFDRQEFDASVGESTLISMHPGMFAIFLPGDAHCPGIELGASQHLRKTVVKIPAGLLGS